MKITLNYLYIFSKLSTSFILLFLLLVLGYFFYVSFKNQEISTNDQLELINKLNKSIQKLSQLSEKIEITENSLDKIKISIQNIKNSNQAEEVIFLNKKIEEFDLSLKNITVNLEEIKTTNISESKETLSNNNSSPIINKNKKQIIRLIIYKFENNIDFNEDLDILQSLNNNKNQHIFEKINLIRLKKFRGNKFLKDIFSKELDIYLKEKFNENSSNIIPKFLMRLILVEPSKKISIKNTETLVLKEINILLQEKNYEMFYKKITTIDNYEMDFIETINQIQIANNFKELINKTI